MRTHEISNRRPETFISSRVGLEFKSFRDDLDNVIESNINDLANFLVIPIAPPRSIFYDCCTNEPNSQDHNELHLIPDLVLPAHIWEREVVITIGHLSFYSEDTISAITIFDKLLKHALYLPSPVIVIDCPENDEIQQSVASVINTNLRDNQSEKLFLFRLLLGSNSKSEPSSRSSQSTTTQSSDYGFNLDINSHQSQASNMQMSLDLLQDITNDSGLGTWSHHSVGKESMSISEDQVTDSWNIWNSFRSRLEPDHRIGLCLEINDDLRSDPEKLSRWTGEPVRMITLSVDRFTSAKGFRNTMRPSGNIREFMRTIALVNSLKTSFVIQEKPGQSVQEQLHCLSSFCDMLNQEHPDELRAWDDTLLSPLQPLSNNLDSNTYQIFENDSAKYSRYRDAMIEALKSLLTRPASVGRNRFVVMVLGAGRGPLVDAMIKSIRKMNLFNVEFKIFALDKNYSSIRSLKFKKSREWDLYLPRIEVEVVEADMRVWEPSEKADIIATELLGSFSDNELSPECIDGTWRFSTPDTISIPQSYSSFIAPIHSYRMEQELYKSRFFARQVSIRDQLQVVRLSNYYTISEPQELFTFHHEDLSKKPVEGANRREASLKFYSKVDTVCHGFAGYFSAKLFGSVSISTVPSMKTPTMESWFSAYIPIDKPIQMPDNTCLELQFFRKESHDKVWYEWMIVKPDASRIYSQDGIGTAMSKLLSS